MMYIGVRSSNIEPKLDLGVVYFSSSSNKDFIKKQKSNPSNFSYEILSIHDNRCDANYEETQLLTLNRVRTNENFYNKCDNSINLYCVQGMVVVIDADDNISHVSMNDPRYISGELKHILKRKVCVYDENNNKNILIDNDDPRYISGELKHFNSNMVNVIDQKGDVFQTKVDDKRIKSGELKYLISEKFKESTINKVVVGDLKGNTYSVDINDPRYLSGELKSINEIQLPVKDINGNRFKIMINDPRYISGEVIHWKSRWLIIENEIYTIKKAIETFGLSRHVIANRCRSTDIKWNQWVYFIENQQT